MNEACISSYGLESDTIKLHSLEVSGRVSKQYLFWRVCHG